MKTQGSFDYKVNGESKTKEEIDSMDLSNMNCTVENLTVSYSFPAEKSLPKTKTWLEEIEKASLEKWLAHRLALPRTKTDDNRGGILKGSEFLYEKLSDEFNEFSEKDDVITNSSRGEKEMIGHFQGIKESQSTEKAPIFTYCKVNKNALEALSLRALYGHKKYNINGADEDWQNFTRVPNAEEEYANAQFRHALEIGGEETEKEHLVSAAWNAVAKLEIYLKKDLEKSK